MRIKFKGLLMIWGIILMIPLKGVSQNLDLKGQMSGWFMVNGSSSTRVQMGLRYIPSFSLKKSWKEKYSLDTEISVNAYGTAQASSLDEIQTTGEIKPYRMWIRFSTTQFEARLGLQKINFGSAMLLRPLMWFDRIDPNDPLQLTDGVYGFLLKYTFLNNANIWLWGLYGNNEPKGWETVPTQQESVEYGGRFQFLLLAGEMAFSYHHRRIDAGKSLLDQPLLNEHQVPENRFALDGKWDIGIGVWFEGALIHQDFRFFPLRYQRNINLGADYTFGLKNGLHIMGEYLIMEASESAFGSGETIKFSVLSLDYPLGLMDRIKGMAFHDWESGDWYRFITWQRMSDRWSFYLIGFWNPDRYQLYLNQQGKNLFAGKGIQIMVVFNH
jgi:hypothetical protein